MLISYNNIVIIISYNNELLISQMRTTLITHATTSFFTQTRKKNNPVRPKGDPSILHHALTL